MEVIKRNTDYALRALLGLGENYGKGVLSVRKISESKKIPYPLACKLMQKLQKNKLVTSLPGPAGGYRLAKSPRKINVLEVVEAVQGPVYFNLCLNGEYHCELSDNCLLQSELKELQRQTNESLKSTKLSDLLNKGD